MKVLSYGWVLALHAGPGGVWLDGRVWEGRGGGWTGTMDPGSGKESTARGDVEVRL